MKVNLNINTIAIAVQLEDFVTEDTLLSEEFYLLIRELAHRQSFRHGCRLSDKKRKDIAHTVATNTMTSLICMYPNGFKVTNWIKYIKNKTFSTIYAIYNDDGSERSNIIELADILEEEEFLKRYHNSQLSFYSQIDDLELEDFIQSLGNYVPNYIKFLLKYNSGYKKYDKICYSAILSFLLKRPIALYGITKVDRQYIKNICAIAELDFLDYIKDKYIRESSNLNNILNELPNLIRYERVQNEFEQ